MPKPKKEQQETAPIAPKIIVIQDTIEIAHKDVIIAFLMRLSGESLEATARYLRIDKSQIEGIPEFQEPTDLLIKGLLKEIRKNADAFPQKANKALAETIFNAVMFAAKSTEMEIFKAAEKSIAVLVGNRDDLQKQLEQEETGSRAWLNMSKELRAIAKEISTLQANQTKAHFPGIQTYLRMHSEDLLKMLGVLK